MLGMVEGVPTDSPVLRGNSKDNFSKSLPQVDEAARIWKEKGARHHFSVNSHEPLNNRG